MKKSNSNDDFKTSQNLNPFAYQSDEDSVKEKGRRELFESNIRTSFESVKKDIILLHKELKDLKNQTVNQLKKKCMTFFAKTDRITSELKESDEAKTREIEDLKKTIVYLEEKSEDLKEFEERLLKIELSLDSLLRETKNNSYVSSELKKTYDSLAKRYKNISRSTVTLKRYEDEISDLSVQINSIKSELYRVEEVKNSILNAQKIIGKISEDYASVKDLEQHNRKISVRINRISNNFKRMQNQIAELAENLASKEEIMQIKSEIESQIMFFEKGLKALQDESITRKEFELRNRGLLQRLSNLRENLYSLSLKIEELSSISEKNSAKLKEIDLIQEKITNNEKRAFKHEQNIRLLKRNLENLKSNLQISEEKNDFLERKIELMSKEIESIKEKVLRVQGIGLKTMEILEEKKPYFRMPELPKITKKFVIKKPSKKTWLITIMLFLLTLIIFLIFNYPNLLTIVVSKLNISLNISENITQISWFENKTNMTANITENMTKITENISENITANITTNITYNITENLTQNLSANETTNLTTNISEEVISAENLSAENLTEKKPELSEKELIRRNELCILRYECRETKNKFYYDCYYGVEDGECHCFIGDYSDCDEKMVEILREKYDVLLPLKRFLRSVYSKASLFLSNAFSYTFFFIGFYKNYFIIALLLLFIVLLFLNYKEEIFDFFTEVEEETPDKSIKSIKRKGKK